MDEPRPSDQEVRDALKAICDSEAFALKKSLPEMLTFIVEHTLAGKEISEMVLLVEVFKRDTRTETTIVRTNAQNLRTSLAEYYDNQGRREEVRIAVPRGGYRADIYYSATIRERAELDRREAVLSERERDIERRHSDFDRKVAEFREEMAKRDLLEVTRQAEYDKKLLALENKLTRQISKQADLTEERAQEREERTSREARIRAVVYDPHDSY